MLKISRQAVYQHRRRESTVRSHEQELLPRVRTLRQMMPRVGGRKLLKHLGAVGLGRDKFFDLLRRHGLLVRRRRCYVITTNSAHPLAVYPNLLPGATVDAPNRVWVADQTYLRLSRGFCYLSLVTDLYSRKIVGYDVAPTLEAEGPIRALRTALHAVSNPVGLIHHSDRGKQYCSTAYTEILNGCGSRISMTAPRRPDQNATAERLNGILKQEFFLDEAFRSIQDARRAVANTITIYNNIRLHQSLGMITPSMKYAA